MKPEGISILRYTSGMELFWGKFAKQMVGEALIMTAAAAEQQFTACRAHLLKLWNHLKNRVHLWVLEEV